ncbi:MAG: succinylglutamate desuccinylase/aspartoacylase family protein [Chthoniobacteraceae bacterium]
MTSSSATFVSQDLLRQIEALQAEETLMCGEIGQFLSGGRLYAIPRLLLRGPDAGVDPVRIGIFAAIHGDEHETAYAALEFLRRLTQEPERARGYEVYVYPVCNPTGLEDGTRQSRTGADLNREFWRQSPEQEVHLLERELAARAFSGVVALHADNTTEGVYAYVRGATLTAALAGPALQAAESFLPRAAGAVIDGFPACDALISDACYHGVLSNPRELKPAPFELIFETPQDAALDLQVEAAVAALDRVLEEYRPFLAFGQDL